MYSFTSDSLTDSSTYWHCRLVLCAAGSMQLSSVCQSVRPPVRLSHSPAAAVTGVNPAGDAGDTSPPIFWLGGTSTGISPQYYYVLLDIADRYWLPSVRSASSRFHSAIRRHQFASVRQADSRLTRLVPPQPSTRVDATGCCRFAAVVAIARRYRDRLLHARRSAARRRSTALGSKCGQRHVVS